MSDERDDDSPEVRVGTTGTLVVVSIRDGEHRVKLELFPDTAVDIAKALKDAAKFVLNETDERLN